MLLACMEDLLPYVNPCFFVSRPPGKNLDSYYTTIIIFGSPDSYDEMW